HHAGICLWKRGKWLRTPECWLPAQQKVAIMPGYAYGKEGNGFVRLNAGCPRSKLEQGVQRLIAGINTLL
ncbi:hypothetical protein ACOY74_19845, partial [Enterobacter roggenkampii]